MDIITINKPVSKDEAAKMLGVKVYDCALPQTWLDEFVKKTGMDYHTALSSFVWSYDVGLLGLPRPLTDEAYVYLWKLDRLTGTRYTMDESVQVLSVN